MEKGKSTTPSSRLPPLEARALDPDAALKDRDLPGDCHFGFLHANPLRQGHAKAFNVDHFLRPVHEHAGCLKRYVSQQSVGPVRALVSVSPDSLRRGERPG